MNVKEAIAKAGELGVEFDAMPVVAPADAWPAGHELGGIEPAVSSMAELETAVEMIAAIRSRQETVLAALQQITDLWVAVAGARLQLQIGDDVVSLDDRQTALVDAIETFVKDVDNHADLFDGKTKTCKFAAGTIKLADCRPSLRFRDGQSKKSVTERLVKKHELAEKLAAYSKRIGISPFLKLKAELDVAGLKRQHEENAVSRKQIADAGLRYVDDDESVTVTTPKPKARTTTQTA